MKKLAIFGSGTFGREVAMLVEQINVKSPSFELIGFFDDAENTPSSINGYPFLGGMDKLNAVDEELHVAIALGNSIIKRKIHERIANPRLQFPCLIHPTVLSGGPELVKMGDGCIIAAYNVITVNITIGNFVVLNLSCTIGHDCVLEDYVSIMPGTNVSGHVHIGKAAYLGTGAKIINNIHIGENTIIGAGAVVTRNIPANCTAVGVPAKPIKTRPAK